MARGSLFPERTKGRKSDLLTAETEGHCVTSRRGATETWRGWALHSGLPCVKGTTDHG